MDGGQLKGESDVRYRVDLQSPEIYMSCSAHHRARTLAFDFERAGIDGMLAQNVFESPKTYAISSVLK